MTTLRAISLLGATVTMGLLAGVFALYAHTIMPGLRNTDDRTFVAAFQSMDRAIVNPWFMATAFLGALVFTIAAVLLNLGGGALPWIAVALALYVVAFVVTVAVNLPLNDALKGRRQSRPHPRPGRCPRALPGESVGGVEPVARGHLDRRIHLPGMGTCPLWPVDDVTPGSAWAGGA